MYFLRDNEETKSQRLSSMMDAGSMLIHPLSDMRSERDIILERIDKDLVAFGEFNSKDLMDKSVNPDDFLSVDGS